MLRGVVLLTVLVALLAVADGQRFFRQVTERYSKWAAREKANIEYVKRTTSFRDGRSDAPTRGSVSLTNYFLMYGGNGDRGTTNDVWASSDGANWLWVAGTWGEDAHPVYPETFEPLYEAAHCQDNMYRQYRAGGRDNNGARSDVYMSQNGYQWQLRSEGQFDAVYLANMVGDTTGTIYIAGGILDTTGDPRKSTGAVWYSRNQGTTWNSATTGYDPRTGMQTGPGERAVSILLNAETNTLIWLTGVNTGYETNDRPESYQKDVWVSTNQGKTFDPINLNTPFGRRDDSNAEITEGGLIVLAGGYGGTGQGLERQGEIYNDVWVSPNGGYSWGLCVGDAEWEDRRYQMTLLDGEGYLWVMGGLSSTGYMEDMWKSQWSFSDTAATAARCRVNVPSCGAGLKCFPNSGNTLVAADGSGVYCDTCPYTFSGQSAAQTTVIAFLVVFVILTVLSVIALIYTYHKLRAAGAPSPIPLPATAQRWWNKQTPGAVASTDSSSTTNGDGLYQPLRIRDQV